MPLTYTAIATVTVGIGGASSITFSSIPATYTDLAIKVSARNDTISNPESYFRLTFNSVNTNYSLRNLYQQSNTVYSNMASGQSSWAYLTLNGDGSTSNAFSNSEIYIPNYAGSNAKVASFDVVVENNNSAAFLGFYAMLNSSTEAITSLTLAAHNGAGASVSFTQHSTATLYGIKNT